MAKNKLNKQQRAQREDSLVLAILNGLVATIEEKAKAWAFKARDLREGLSATAIKRAERKAHKLADESPPGFVKAMEAMELYEQICRRYKIPKRDRDILWGHVAQFCMFQLAAKSGPFYQAARYFGMFGEKPEPKAASTPEPEPRMAIPVAVVRIQTPGCNCPNCRPRTAEDFNSCLSG